MIEEFRLVGKDLFDLGLIDSSCGNLSLRRGDKIYITKRGARLGHLVEEDILEVGLEEGETDKEASREIKTHRAIYKSTSSQAIAHAHPPYTISLSITENKIMTADAEGQYFFPSGVPIVRVRQPIGSEEAAKMLPSFINDRCQIAAVKGHGVFAVGQSLIQALHQISCLENSCKIIFITRNLAQRVEAQPQTHPAARHRSAIPPSIGVMDRSSRSRYKNR